MSRILRYFNSSGAFRHFFAKRLFLLTPSRMIRVIHGFVDLFGYIDVGHRCWRQNVLVRVSDFSVAYIHYYFIEAHQHSKDAVSGKHQQDNFEKSFGSQIPYSKLDCEKSCYITRLYEETSEMRFSLAFDAVLMTVSAAV